MIRETRETRVEVEWAPRGESNPEVATGIGFLDHMLGQWAFHGGFELRLTCQGDLGVDAHHTVEDVALALGEEMDRRLGDRAGLWPASAGPTPPWTRRSAGPWWTS